MMMHLLEPFFSFVSADWLTSSGCALSGTSSSNSCTVGVEENQPPGKKREDEIELMRERVEVLSSALSTAARGVSSGLTKIRSAAS
jgi:hypothetical protein